MLPSTLRRLRRKRFFVAAIVSSLAGWEHGERNGLPARVPRSIEILVALVLKVPEARDWLLNREREHE